MFSWLKPKQHADGYSEVSDGPTHRLIDIYNTGPVKSSEQKHEEPKKTPTPLEDALGKLSMSSMKNDEIEAAVIRKIVLAIQKGATLIQIETAMKYSITNANNLIKKVVESDRRGADLDAFRAAYQKAYPSKPQAPTTVNILNL